MFFIGCDRNSVIVSDDPDAYPFRLVVEENYPAAQEHMTKQYTTADINKDGIDELIELVVFSSPDQPRHLLTAYSVDHRVVGQINFGESSVVGLVNYKFNSEVNNSSFTDIILNKQRNDTLIAVVCNLLKGTFKEIPVYAKPNSFQNKNWDAGISASYIMDANNDGSIDLICYLFAAYSMIPRGLFAYDLQSCKQLWKYSFGSVPSCNAILEDINNDGQREIIFGTFASGNGATANGIDDSHSYVLSFSQKGSLVWKTLLGGIGTHSSINYFTENGRPRIAVLVSNSRTQYDSSYVVTLDALNGIVLKRSKNFNGDLCESAENFVQATDKSSTIQIIATTVKGELLIFNNSLELVHRIDLGGSVEFQCGYNIIADSKHGGFPYLAQVTLKDGRTMFFDKTDNVCALSNSFIRKISVRRNMDSQNAAFFCYGRDGWFTAHFEENKYYLFYRYKLFAGIIALGVVLVVSWSFRRFNFYYWLYVQLLKRSQQEGIIVLDKKGRAVHISSTASATLGIPRYPLKKTSRQHVLDIPHLADVKRFITDTLALNKAGREQFILSVDSQQRHIVCSISPIRNFLGRKLGWLILINDITQTIEHDRVLNWAAVAKNLAHEMKTPLGTVLLNTEYLREQLALQNNLPSSIYTAKIDTVREEIGRLDSYIKNFMKLANLQPANLQPNNIIDVLNNLLIAFEKRKPDKITVQRKFAAQLPVVLIDVNLFTTAIVNLLDNAIAAITDKGEIIIETALVQDLTSIDKRMLEISIHDNGCGIAPEDMPLIFQPFFTKSINGTGLGLTITKKIIEDHGGSINVTSETGRGTGITIRLPVNADKEKDNG
jgi:PAS domain S-box-containing protein